MLVCILAVVTAIAVVVTAAALFRRFGRGAEDRDPGGATAGHAGSMLSALFLLVFAIAIVVPWTTADSARQNAYAESRALVEAYWAAAALPAPAGAEIQSGLRDYTGLLLGDEWHLMQRGHLTERGWTELDALRTKVANLPVAGDDQKDDRTAVLTQIQALETARGQRAMDAKARPPAGLLWMTILAGLVVLVFPLLAGARPKGMTVIPLSVLAALLGVGVYLAWDISHVFSGALRVKPDAFATAQQEFQRIPASR